MTVSALSALMRLSLYYTGAVTDIIAAHVGRTDVTMYVRYFYSHDRLGSVAALQRWMSNFVPQPDQIVLIFARDGLIYRSRIDLNADMELLTQTEIPSCDMAIRELPAQLLCEFDQEVTD
jgi:hypothetical protein